MLKTADEKELEEKLYPLWLSHHTARQITGGEILPYAELLERVQQKVETQTTALRSIADIESEFTPIIEAQRRKEAPKNG